MLIRPARPADAAAIARVHVRTWRAAYVDILPTATLAALDEDVRARLWRRRLTRPEIGQQVLVAVRDGDPVGFIHLGPTGDPDDDPGAVGQVFALHVDPTVAGRGVGGTLLRAAVDEFAKREYSAATLWVVQSNRGARCFYERAGWSADGTGRREPLAAEGEAGELVTVVRYRTSLGSGPSGSVS